MTMKIISLGWGVQSFTLAAMVALGELEPVDYAIHADTTHEASWTYDFADRWREWLIEHGVNVVTVVNTSTELGQRAVVDIPAFTASKKGYGKLRRQCTSDWKISHIRRWIQKQRKGKPIEMWIGISLDEFQRMRDSDVKYITNRYPLIERKLTRQDCMAWLDAHGLETPQRSSCTFCPFHDQDEWRNIKSVPEDWRKATEVDGAIRKARPACDLFVHPSRVALETIDFRTDTERGQLSLWDEECTGICGV